MSGCNDDITLCSDERGELLIHPYVAQIARAFGRSDLGYVLSEYSSLRFYRGLAGYVRKIPPTFYHHEDITGLGAFFFVDRRFIEHYEKILRESAIATWVGGPGWIDDDGRAALPGMDIRFAANGAENYLELFSRSVTVPVSLTVQSDDGVTRSERLLLFLSGPFDVAWELSEQVYEAERERVWRSGHLAEQAEWNYIRALGKCAQPRKEERPALTFGIANVLRAKLYTGPPLCKNGFVIPAPAVFDYLAALDEVQRTTGITSLRELEAQVAPPHLDEGSEASHN